MSKESFNRIIDALEVKYVVMSSRRVIRSCELINTVEQKDILVRIDQGIFAADFNSQPLPPGSFYLVPRGNLINFKHGKFPFTEISKEGFASQEDREQYLQPVTSNYSALPNDDLFSIAGFEVLIHGAIPFFSIIDLPTLRIPYNSEISNTLNEMMNEVEADNIGKTALLNKKAFELVIFICRYIYNNPTLDMNLQKLKFLNDKRLIDIIQFIQDNLEKDLANHQIASLAYVSKDYIGQFFKSLTNQNLQDYIENRRLERAHYLLRTTHDNIQEIAHKVGFKDPAYFSRRFKIKYDQNAKEIRKSEFLIM